MHTRPCLVEKPLSALWLGTSCRRICATRVPIASGRLSAPHASIASFWALCIPSFRCPDQSAKRYLLMTYAHHRRRSLALLPGAVRLVCSRRRQKHLNQSLSDLPGCTRASGCDTRVCMLQRPLQLRCQTMRPCVHVRVECRGHVLCLSVKRGAGEPEPETVAPSTSSFSSSSSLSYSCSMVAKNFSAGAPARSTSVPIAATFTSS